MSRQKYLDFIDSEPVTKPGKKAPWTPTAFVGITCPHCNQKFVELPVDNMKTGRAAQCLKHLRVCESFKAKGGEVAAAPGKTSELEKLKEKVASMEGRISTLWEICGGGDPAPTTWDQLEARLPQKVDEIGVKRKREEELSTYNDWTPEEEKKMKKLVHPDKHAGYSAGFNRWRDRIQEEMLEAHKRS